MLGADGAVVGLRTERQELTGDGNVRGTGEFTDWDVQAVYRAVGYRSEAIEDLPFDTRRFVLPNDGGRLIDLDGAPLPGLYATGWVKRGPVGLIGHTKSDAAETIANLLADAPDLSPAPRRDSDGIDALLVGKGLTLHRLRRAGTGSTRTSWPPASRTAGPDEGHLPHRHDGDRRPRLTPPPPRRSTSPARVKWPVRGLVGQELPTSAARQVRLIARLGRRVDFGRAAKCAGPGRGAPHAVFCVSP